MDCKTTGPYLLETLFGAVSLRDKCRKARGEHVVEADPHARLDYPRVVPSQRRSVEKPEAWTVHHSYSGDTVSDDSERTGAHSC